MEPQRLIIVGAGPKAMAIASKSTVLREMGFRVPEIHIIEKRGVGANWTGDAGYTNGRLALGTSPEKDVGFPYHSTGWGESYNRLVDERMTRFSWQSHLVATGRLSDWVDRGRPAPCHREWAGYLQWVAASVSDHIRLHRGEVNHVRLTGEGRWEVSYAATCGVEQSLEGDGLVITGPGKIRLASALPIHDRLLTVESFWRTCARFRDLERANVAVIGTGENAASITMALAETTRPGLRIEVISPSGMTFSRGESFRENRVYSDPESGSWEKLTPEDRRQFIYRTDRGVFSLHAQKALDQAKNVDVRPGRVNRVSAAGDKLSVDIAYAGSEERVEYDYVVVATGADQLAFLRDLLDPQSHRALCERANVAELAQREIEPLIDEALGVKDLSPRLHLPMLSGVAQGPGFANLSCLGRLSDRILAPYVRL